jgi:flavin-binding protein dodecin
MRKTAAPNREDGGAASRSRGRAIPPGRGPPFRHKEKNMSVARVTEITSASDKSFEDAIEKGIERANETLDNIEGAWVQDMKVVCDSGKIKEYRVNMKVTFVLKG